MTRFHPEIRAKVQFTPPFMTTFVTTRGLLGKIVEYGDDQA